jgi:hypothetical protein
LTILVRLAVALLLILASPAMAGDGFPTAVPMAISDFKYSGRENYEQKDPGAGIGYRFLDSSGRLDVFVYGAGLPGPPSAADIKVIFQRSTDAVVAAGKQGLVSSVKILETFSLKVGKQRVQCRSFSFMTKGLGDADSYLCVGTSYGKILKVRLTMKKSSAAARSPKQLLSEALRQFGA